MVGLVNGDGPLCRQHLLAGISRIGRLEPEHRVRHAQGPDGVEPEGNLVRQAHLAPHLRRHGLRCWGRHVEIGEAHPSAPVRALEQLVEHRAAERHELRGGVLGQRLRVEGQPDQLIRVRPEHIIRLGLHLVPYPAGCVQGLAQKRLEDA